jgi:hypothetical protein
MSLELLAIPEGQEESKTKQWGYNKETQEPSEKVPNAKAGRAGAKKVALFTIATLWDEPPCPPTDESIKKMCYIYIMEYYSAIKNNISYSFQENG